MAAVNGLLQGEVDTKAPELLLNLRTTPEAGATSGLRIQDDMDGCGQGLVLPGNDAVRFGRYAVIGRIIPWIAENVPVGGVDPVTATPHVPGLEDGWVGGLKINRQMVEN